LGLGCACDLIGLAQPVVNAGGVAAKFLGQFTVNRPGFRGGYEVSVNALASDFLASCL
jgi:hypothetical protein